MIRDKLVLITGATAGIGEAAARRLAGEGARVALWARRADRLQKLAKELNAITAVVDVRDRTAIAAALDALIVQAGVPHVLLNNAGLGAGFAKFHEGKPDDWDVNIETNFKGAAYVARAVIPHMLQAGRGHVINIGSTAAHMVAPRGHVERAMETYRGFQPLSPDDVADALLYVANLPDHVNVADLVLVPRAQRNMYVIDRDADAT